jgi:hypothetical protein
MLFSTSFFVFAITLFVKSTDIGSTRFSGIIFGFFFFELCVSGPKGRLQFQPFTNLIIVLKQLSPS